MNGKITSLSLLKRRYFASERILGPSYTDTFSFARINDENDHENVKHLNAQSKVDRFEKSTG